MWLVTWLWPEPRPKIKEDDLFFPFYYFLFFLRTTLTLGMDVLYQWKCGRATTTTRMPPDPERGPGMWRGVRSHAGETDVLNKDWRDHWARMKNEQRIRATSYCAMPTAHHPSNQIRQSIVQKLSANASVFPSICSFLSFFLCFYLFVFLSFFLFL